MTKLHGQVAVITGATAGMALAAAKLFVTEGAHVYITGRRKDQLDNAVSEIGGNVTGVRSDSGNPRLCLSTASIGILAGKRHGVPSWM